MVRRKSRPGRGLDKRGLDGDGKPGATFTVSGTFCSGDLYVASQSHYSVERAQLDEHGLSASSRLHKSSRFSAQAVCACGHGG